MVGVICELIGNIHHVLLQEFALEAQEQRQSLARLEAENSSLSDQVAAQSKQIADSSTELTLLRQQNAALADSLNSQQAELDKESLQVLLHPQFNVYIFEHAEL